MIILTQKIFIYSERLEEFQRNFQERCDYSNIELKKTPGILPPFRRDIVGKTTGGGGQFDNPSLFTVNHEK